MALGGAQDHLLMDHLAALDVLHSNGAGGAEVGAGPTGDAYVGHNLERCRDLAVDTTVGETYSGGTGDGLTGSDAETAEDTFLIRLLDGEGRLFDAHLRGQLLDDFRRRGLRHEQLEVESPGVQRCL